MAQSSYKLILPHDIHQTYSNLMAQYHLSHPFADRMREHFVATIAEFMVKVKVNRFPGGMKVSIPSAISASTVISHKIDSFASNKVSQKAEPSGSSLSESSGMKVVDDFPPGE